MAEKIFDAQSNYGWGLSLNMTGKAPAVAKRIFDTYADALAYANDVNDSAIEGLVLSVVADTDDKLNGVYFVQQAASAVVEANEAEGIEAADAKEAILVKLGSADAADNGAADALTKAKAYTDQEVKELADGAVKTNTDKITILNGDASTNGSVAYAVAAEKSRAEGKEGELKTAIDNEKAAREAADNAIKATIGTVAEDKTVVKMIEEAQAAAEAAATKMKLATDEAFLTLEPTTDDAGTITYTLGTKDLASDAELQSEKERAVAAEASLQSQIGKAATEQDGPTGLHKAIADVKGAYEAAIEAMDATKTGKGTFVDVTVKQANGVITEVTVAESDIASASALTAEIGRATSAETALDGRLDVIEGEGVGSIKKAVADAKAELLGDAATDYNTLGKLEDKIIAVSGAAKTYSIYQVVGDELTSLGANVKEAYKLVENGNEKAGEYIKVYKDSSLQSVALVGQELQFTYLLASGQTSTVSVDVSNFLAESEFKDGLQVVDHVVSVKRDSTSEGFLTVGANGIKLSGVQTAIDNAITAETQNRTNAINALNATAGTQDISEGTHVAVQVVETAGKLTSLVVTEDDIASADELKALKDVVGTGFTTGDTVANKIADNSKAITDEANTRKADDDAINAKIGDVPTDKTVVGMINEAKAAAIAASTVVSGDSQFITITQTGETGKTQTYTITTQDIASETATTKAINDEVTRAKSAEKANAYAIAAEVTRAEAAEKANADAIAAEVTRAKGIEDGLNSRLTTVEGDYVKSVEAAEGSMITVSDTEQKVTLSLQWGTF